MEWDRRWRFKSINDMSLLRSESHSSGVKKGGKLKRRLAVLTTGAMLLVIPGSLLVAQQPQGQPSAQQLAQQTATRQDHQRMMELLKITAFISSGATKGDGWADPKGMFLAAAAAGPVYRLLGKKDLGTSEFPPIETPLIDGDVAFRQHGGGHTPGPNWPTFLTFASRYIKGTTIPATEAATPIK